MDESSSLDALFGIIGKLEENPRDLSLHIQHVRLAKSLEGMETQVTFALELFTKYFAVGDEIWLDLLNIKEHSINLDTVNGVEEILTLYQRAEADYLCKDISLPSRRPLQLTRRY